MPKLFDTINHSRLLIKLEKYVIRGITLQLIESYLRNRMQTVRVNGTSNESLEMKNGSAARHCTWSTPVHFVHKWFTRPISTAWWYNFLSTGKTWDEAQRNIMAALWLLIISQQWITIANYFKKSVHGFDYIKMPFQ